MTILADIYFDKERSALRSAYEDLKSAYYKFESNSPQFDYIYQNLRALIAEVEGALHIE